MTYCLKDALAVLNRVFPGLPPELALLYAQLALTRGTRTTATEACDAFWTWRDTVRPAYRHVRFAINHKDAIHRTARELSR